MITYNTIIILSWATFLIVWGIGALNVKRNIKGSGFSLWWTRALFSRWTGVAIAAGIVFAAVRIATRTAHYTDRSFVSQSLFMPPLFLGWMGALFAVLGIAFAIWARVHLGRNWSASPSIKENHELVTTGPYAWVRHPIYTGVLLAAFGAALTGSYFGIAICVLGSIMFFLRIGKEEKIMLNLFPNEYPAYQTRTKRLIPWVW